MNLTTKKIQDQASGVPFFFKVELVEDPADIEDSELNISVTDGARSWSRKGTYEVWLAFKQKLHNR